MTHEIFDVEEIKRVASLHALNILDTACDVEFDRITRLTSRVLQTPIALLSFIDNQRQWFKSCIGLDVTELTLEWSFCARTILTDEPLVISDATQDARFADNPLVSGSPHIRFYAGAPITTAEGYRIGSLCIIDTHPRILDSEKLALLIDFAALISQRIQQNEALALAQNYLDDAVEVIDARFRTMFEKAAVGIALVAPDGGWIRVNTALCNIVGYTPDELSQLTFQDITYPEDLAKDLNHLQQLVVGEIDRYQMEKRYIRKDKTTVWVSLSVTKQTNVKGELDYFVSIIENIQARKEAEASLASLRRDLEHKVDERTMELRKANEMLSYIMEQQIRFEQKLLKREAELSAVLENANDAYVCMDQAGVVSAWNRQAHETFGWSAREAIGQRIDELIIPPGMREAHRKGMSNYLKTGEAKVLDKRLELPAIRKDGSGLSVEIRIRAINLDDTKIFSAFLHDITDRKRLEELREHEALHDALTSLPNRRALFEHIPKAIARSNRTGQAMGLLFMDLDNFKIINDTLGHDIGDSLLIEVAHRLSRCVRQTDTVARLSGDEFTIIVENLMAGYQDAECVAQKILSNVCTPAEIGQNTIEVGASIGIAIHMPGTTISADDLLKLADSAMYKVKRERKTFSGQ
jgi:diguanylate cyclase